MELRGSVLIYLCLLMSCCKGLQQADFAWQRLAGYSSIDFYRCYLNGKPVRISGNCGPLISLADERSVIPVEGIWWHDSERAVDAALRLTGAVSHLLPLTKWQRLGFITNSVGEDCKDTTCKLTENSLVTWYDYCGVLQCKEIHKQNTRLVRISAGVTKRKRPHSWRRIRQGRVIYIASTRPCSGIYDFSEGTSILEFVKHRCSLEGEDLLRWGILVSRYAGRQDRPEDAYYTPLFDVTLDAAYEELRPNDLVVVVQIKKTKNGGVRFFEANDEALIAGEIINPGAVRVIGKMNKFFDYAYPLHTMAPATSLGCVIYSGGHLHNVKVELCSKAPVKPRTVVFAFGG